MDQDPISFFQNEESLLKFNFHEFKEINNVTLFKIYYVKKRKEKKRIIIIFE